MNLQEQLELARAEYNRCRTNLEQAQRGASTAKDYFVISIRAEKLARAAHNMDLIIEQIESEKQNVII